MVTLWDGYREIRRRLLSNLTKDELIDIITDLEKLIVKVSKEEEKQLKRID